MSVQEMLKELNALKVKLANTRETSPEFMDFTIALIALQDSIIYALTAQRKVA